jgi:hypothetical protein
VALLLLTASCAAEAEAELGASSKLVPTYDAKGSAPDVTDAETAAAETEAVAQEPAASAATAAPTEGPAAPASDATAHDGAPSTTTAGASADDADTEEPGTRTEEPDAPSSVTSTVTDPRGDTTRTLLGSAPAWADLVAGSVGRTGTGDVTITLELAAPPSSPQRGTTMNVAAFHDLTGDGHVDLEVWANWSDAGWFPSWRDNREGRAAYGADTGIAVQMRDATLELVVPAERFGEHERWRWSLGLEWGRYESLGTAAAAHDLAPDEGAVAHDP